MQLTDDAAVRLTFGDDLFARRHRGMGSPVVSQLVWRFDEPLRPSALAELRDALASGALSRRVHRPRVPGARARWSRDHERPPLLLRTEPLREAEVTAWVRGLVLTPLDPARGGAWRLASAPVADGGHLVSLVASHAVADGGAMIDAVERAAAGRDALRLPDRPGPLESVASDLRDAGTQAAEVGRWVAGAVRNRRRSTPAPGPVAVTPPTVRQVNADDGSASWHAPMVVVECPTAQVTAAAARLGGTPNAWFVALAASVAASLDPAPRALRIALPVSARGADDLRANATRIASVTIGPGDLAPRDLAGVRALCKQAYATLGRPAAGTATPLALVQMLPDPVVRRLPQPPPADVLASNLGTLSDAFCSIGGSRARSVTAMAGPQAATVADVRAMGGGLMAWAADCGDRTTFSMAALDPDRVHGDAALEAVVVRTLREWGVDEATPW